VQISAGGGAVSARCKSTREEVGDLRFSSCREEVAVETFEKSDDIRREELDAVGTFKWPNQSGRRRFGRHNHR